MTSPILNPYCHLNYDQLQAEIEVLTSTLNYVRNSPIHTPEDETRILRYKNAALAALIDFDPIDKY